MSGAAHASAGSALIAALERHASERPDALAIVECSARSGERRLSWKALRDAAATLGGEWVREGGEPPRVVVGAPNCLEQVTALVAGLGCGADVVMVAPDLPLVRLREIVRASGATRLLCAEPLAGFDAPGVRVDAIQVVALEGARGAPLREAHGGGALLLSTSGTTGAPKLVRRTSRAIDAVACGCASALGLAHDDAMLLALPLHHSYGIDLCVAALRAGCRIDLHDGFSPQRVLAALRGDGVTTLPAVPYLFDLLARSARQGERLAPTLRRAVSAGGVLPRAVFDEFRARFQIPIGQIYGATEFGSITYSDPRSPGFRPDSVGSPLADVQIRLLAPDAPSPARPIAPGAEGVVAVSAASMFEGYVGEAKSPLVDGFFLTGDLGRIDTEGRLALTGRVALLIDVGGRKVNPLEVESVLEAHPAVESAAVVPVPFSRTVSRLKAIVVPSPGGAPGADVLRAFLRERIEDYKIPRVYELRDALPRSPTGKLLRSQLEAS